MIYHVKGEKPGKGWPGFASLVLARRGKDQMGSLCMPLCEIHLSHYGSQGLQGQLYTAVFDTLSWIRVPLVRDTLDFLAAAKSEDDYYRKASLSITTGHSYAGSDRDSSSGPPHLRPPNKRACSEKPPPRFKVRYNATTLSRVRIVKEEKRRRRRSQKRTMDVVQESLPFLEGGGEKEEEKERADAISLRILRTQTSSSTTGTSFSSGENVEKEELPRATTKLDRCRIMDQVELELKAVKARHNPNTLVGNMTHSAVATITPEIIYFMVGVVFLIVLVWFAFLAHHIYSEWDLVMSERASEVCRPSASVSEGGGECSVLERLAQCCI